MISSDEDIYNNVVILLNKLWSPDSDKKIRALGVGVSNLSEIYKVQLSIFGDKNLNKDSDNLQKTIDEIKNKFGDKAIGFADDIKNKD